MIYDDINVTKRETITNGEKYDFFIYDMLSIEKQFSDKDKKFGKGDSSQKIYNIISKYKFPKNIKKKFFDII